MRLIGSRDLAGTLARAAGWLLIVVPFVPLRALFHDPPGTSWILDPGEWLLGLFVLAALAWLLARLAPGLIERVERAGVRILRAPSEAGLRAIGLAVLAGILLLVAFVAFARRPLLIDSMIQLFQAKMFAGGAASAPAPPLEAFFVAQHMMIDEGRWYSQYPPGHPAALALGVWLGAPWLVPVALTLGSAWLIADFARRAFDAATGRLTLLLLALARPQTVVNLPRVEGSVILAFDVSGSMAADDLKPTRMEAAK
ncbi:MAG: hypothetical protein ACRELC_14570, partial [Gemmatimonadota bacterium]